MVKYLIYVIFYSSVITFFIFIFLLNSSLADKNPLSRVGILLLRIFISCRTAIREEKQLSSRRQSQTIGGSLSSKLQERLQSLVDRAEKRMPQNQVSSDYFYL